MGAATNHRRGSLPAFWVWRFHLGAEGWAIVIGAFFSGLTGLLLATLPLILQLRSNQKSVRVNTVAAAANTVALNHVSKDAAVDAAELARLQVVEAATIAADPMVAREVLAEFRRSAEEVLGPPSGAPGDGRSIVPDDR